MSDIGWYIDGRLGIKVGDITEERVDGIVNAANSSLMGGGGVDGAIHRKGGGAVRRLCMDLRRKSYPDGLPTGEAAVTESGKLPCRRIIHTVGPIWNGGGSGEADMLASAYRRSLERAEELELGTVAFPSISTGTYGYPKAEAAAVSLKTIKAHLARSFYPRKVLLVFFKTGDRDAFLEYAGL